MLNVADIALVLLAGTIAGIGGLAFHSLSSEQQRRWKRPYLIVCGVVLVLGLVIWIASLVAAVRQI